MGPTLVLWSARHSNSYEAKPSNSLAVRVVRHLASRTMTTAAWRDTGAEQRAEPNADELLTRLDTALKRAGLRTDVIEPSTKLKVFSPSGNAHLDEILTLAPGKDEVLNWWFSWGTAVGPASNVSETVNRVKAVVSTRLA